MDIITLALAKKYANKVAAGFSSVSVEDNKIIFTLNDGKTAEMTVPTPENGSDGISVIDLSIDADGSLLCHMSDGSIIDAGKVPTIEPEHVQADWSQNDETAPDYIKNRPFYESTTATNIINPAKMCHFVSTGVGDAFSTAEYYFNDEEQNLFKNIPNGQAIAVLTINDMSFESEEFTINNGEFWLSNWSIEEVGSDIYRISIAENIMILDNGTGNDYDLEISLSLKAPGEVVKIDEKYLPDTVVFEDEVAQSDWNQNDSTQPDYIKNRPFYEDVTTNEIVILEKGDRDFPLTNDEMMFYTYTFTEEEKTIMNSLTSGTLKLTVNSEYSQEKYIADIQQSVVANGPESFNVTLGDGNTVRFRLKGDSLYITLADETRYNVELVCITETSSIVKIDEKFLPDSVTAQPDWNQNDETAPDYIKNRICYEASETHTVLEKAERTSTMIFEIGQGFEFPSEYANLIYDNSFGYKLTIGDEIFEGVKEGEGGLELTSSQYGSISVNPMGIVFIGNYNDTINAIVEFIMILSGNVVKIDEKYLPDTVATKEYVDKAIGTALEGSY